MNLCDFEYIKQNINTSDLMGSDSCLANIYLLQPKYKTEIKIKDNVLYRKYFGTENRFGYAYPISLSRDEKYIKKALSEIFLKNPEIEDISFCLCTQFQKNKIDECLRVNFPDYKIDWKTNRNDCDYVYLRKNLAELHGSILQKKKNHISRFKRAYENQWEFKVFPEQDILSDILKVEELWFEERSNDIEKSFDNHSLTLEKESIKIAVENADLFGLTGGVLYINGNPAAMCMAAKISDNVLDILFEKALSFAAENGAYAAINNLFVQSNPNYEYINREEDMGVEGLRKAKLSYKPEILLDKFYGRIVKC